MGCLKGKSQCKPAEAAVRCRKCGALADKKGAVCKPEARQENTPMQPATDKEEKHAKKHARKELIALDCKCAEEKRNKPQKHAKHHKLDGLPAATVQRGQALSPRKEHKKPKGEKMRAASVDEPDPEEFGAEGVLLDTLAARKCKGKGRKEKKK